MNIAPINIVFHGPPPPAGSQFVAVELDDGTAVDAQWVERGNGYWALRITELPAVTAAAPPSFRGVEWSRGGPVVLLAGKDGKSQPIFITAYTDYTEPEEAAEAIVDDLLAFLNGGQNRLA